MIDIGVTKLVIIGGIALVVIGPEKMPALAKTAGTLLGRARRYVADVKAEVNRSMELDELKKMHDTFQSAARDVEQTIHTSASQFENELEGIFDSDSTALGMDAVESFPEYKNPRKKWRVKQGATPQWYKARTGMRTRAQSGAARVARFRPPKVSS